MKIYNVPGVMKAYNKNKIQQKASVRGVEGKKDAMQVSNEAQLMNKILQGAKNAPDIREKKVSELKSAIKQGTYNVSAADVAEKMLKGINLNKKA